MRRIPTVAVLAALCACSSVNMFPSSKTGGGDDGQGGSGHGDGGVTGPDGSGGGSGTISGKVCLMSDLRTPFSNCSNTGAAGLTVALGTSVATTSNTGNFVIDAPGGTNLVWQVSGEAAGNNPIETSLMAFGAGGVVIPAISTNDYGTVDDDNPPGFDDTTLGSIVVTVTEDGTPLANEVAIVSPSAVAVYYDDTTADAWNTDETRSHGVVWSYGIPPGTASIEVAPQSTGFGSGSGSGDGVAQDIAIGSGAITFVQVDTL